jgi:SAM-dependent methyltransferase
MSGDLLERVLERIGGSRRVDAQTPLARALIDHARSGRARTLRVERSGGVRYRMDTRPFFELGGEQGPIDAALLDACGGRVLDVGAGAGRHALALQARGLDVCAIDVSSDCVELMRARGVRDARVFDVWRAIADGAGELGAFDTILFGMQTIGLTGSVDGLLAMLDGLRRSPGLLASGGCVLLDSSAPAGPGFVQRVECAPPGEPAGPLTDDSLAGETLVSFVYPSWRGRSWRGPSWRGEPFEWLYVGAEALARLAGERGFETEILARLAASPEYAARLRAREADPASPPVVGSSDGRV